MPPADNNRAAHSSSTPNMTDGEYFAHAIAELVSWAIQYGVELRELEVHGVMPDQIAWQHTFAALVADIINTVEVERWPFDVDAVFDDVAAAAGGALRDSRALDSEMDEASSGSG